MPGYGTGTLQVTDYIKSAFDLHKVRLGIVWSRSMGSAVAGHCGVAMALHLGGGDQEWQGR